MEKSEKNQIIELLETIKQAVEYASADGSNSSVYIIDAGEALNSIVLFIKEKDDKYNTDKIMEISNRLKSYINFDESNRKKHLINEVNEINKIITELKENGKRKIKALFLPYKASMWTSLESIFLAADSDVECEAVVLPIPYHNLDNEKNKIKLCYEGEEYPAYVPVKKFWEYDIETEKPDVIFIHNPYDDINFITMVAEEYHSLNLKKHTKMLVYSPYHTTARYNPEKKQNFCFFPGVNNADKVIVQNKELKDLFIEHGHAPEKIEALGSPKIDSIRKIVNSPLEISQKWKDKIKDRPVFLLSTTLNFFNRYEVEAFKRVIGVYKAVEANNGFLIWRPHPLTEEMLGRESLRLLEEYKNLRNEIDKSNCSLIDYEADYRYSFSISKALISTHSSMINEYMATEKPIFVIEEIKNKKISFVDYEHNYYIYEHDINEFIKTVASGKKDEFYEERKKGLEKSFTNGIDGTAGKKIYEKIKEEVLSIKR